MKKLFGIFFLIFPTLLLASDICPFSDARDMAQQGQDYLEEFSRIGDLQAFHAVNSTDADQELSKALAKEAFARFKKQKQKDLLQSWGPDAYEILSHLENSPYFKSFRSEIKVMIWTPGEGLPSVNFATPFLDVSVSGPVLDYFYGHANPVNFKKMISGIIGHEIGHYVKEQVDFQRTGVRRQKLGAQGTPEEIVRNHMLIDAIGMTLAGITPLKFAQALQTVINFTEGKKGVNPANAEMRTRVRCYQGLK